MKVVRFRTGGRTRYGVLVGNGIRALKGSPYTSLKRATTGSSAFGQGEYELTQVKVLSPCVPSKIVLLGLNYRRHARELGKPLPAEPIIILKPPTTVVGPEATIMHPQPGMRVDYEGELGVVIGRKARAVPRAKAAEYVLGYTCFNDVTARELQEIDGDWTRSKSFDTFAAIGPHIETELDPGDLQIETYLNGQVRQSARTSDLLFSVAEVVEFISHIMTLLPGDIIATGTPSGVGPMKPGDMVEVRIENIGTLRNYVVAAC